MQRTQLTIAFLLGVIVVLGGALLATTNRDGSRAYAQAPSGSELTLVAGTGNQSQGKDTIYLLDPKSMRLVVYRQEGANLTLIAARDITYDLKMQEYSPRNGKQDPTVEELKERFRQQDAGGGKKK